MEKNKINIKRKEPAIILLDVLLKGYPVIKDDITYWLSKDNCLCQEATSKDTKTKKKVLYKIGLGQYTFKNFIDWANTFTFDELAINVNNKVLNDLRRE